MPDDFTLELLTPTLKAGVKADFAFRVLDRKGQAVKKYEIRHEKPLHLILVSRDLNLFRHVHPTLGSDGTWKLTLDPLPVGPYRAYADCQPVDGPVLALGADFAVARPLPPPSRTKTVDGYKVTLDGTLAAGGMSMLTMTVRRGGQPVTDLEPYLGALGHLVTIAASDLSYLHVHPMEMPVGPGQVMFHIVFPAAAAYRLFFQFQHGGVVRTAPFTVESPAPAVGAAATAATTNQVSREQGQTSLFANRSSTRAGRFAGVGRRSARSMPPCMTIAASVLRPAGAEEGG